MSYQVSYSNGVFYAVNHDDPPKFFRSDFWHPFQRELQCRLISEARAKVRKAAPGTEGRESGD